MKRKTEFRYSKLTNILKEQIYSGFVKPGQYLMSENELCHFYQLSRTSVRKSLQELAKEGLIVKSVGRGTVVSPDLVIPTNQKKVLRIVATSPAFFVDTSMRILIDDFKQMHPNVDVKLLNFPGLSFWESIRASKEMGLNPDLIFVSDRQFHEASELNDFMDLNDCLAIDTDEGYPRLISAFSKQGELKAIPATFSTVFLAYNPDLFNQHGVEHPHKDWSGNDFIKAARRMTLDTDGNGITDVYGLSLSSSISRWPVIALQHMNHFTFKQDSEKIHDTLSYIHDLIYKHHIVTLYKPSQSRINSDAFKRGKAAMVLTTTIESATWRKEGMDFEPMVATLPFGQHQSSLLIANAFMIPTQAEEPELAALFLQHFYQPDFQEKLSAQTQLLSPLHSVNASLWDSDYLESLNIRNGRIDHSYFLYEVFPDLQITAKLEREMELYWAGLDSAEQVVQRLNRIWNEHSQ